MRLAQDPESGFFTGTGDYRLVNVHPEAACAGRGCAIHNHPTLHPLMFAPLNWRDDKDILERVCTHGIGHPDHDSAIYLQSVGDGVHNLHGCDGCCGGVGGESWVGEYCS